MKEAVETRLGRDKRDSSPPEKSRGTWNINKRGEDFFDKKLEKGGVTKKEKRGGGLEKKKKKPRKRKGPGKGENGEREGG